MAKKKRQVSAQTRTKLSQAAKKRRRGPKGSIYGGRFAAGLGSAGARHHYAMGGPQENAPGGKRPQFEGSKWGSDSMEKPLNVSRIKSGGAFPGDVSNSLFKEAYPAFVRDFRKKGMGPADAHRSAMSRAREYALMRTNVEPDLASVNLPVHMTTRGPDSDRKRADRVLAGMSGAAAQRSKPKTTKEYFKEMPVEVKAQFEDPSSNIRKRLAEGITTTGSVKGKYYNSPGERDRQDKFIRAVAQGANTEDAIRIALQDRRGQTVAGNVTRQDLAESVKNRRMRTGMRSQTESMAPRAGEFQFGVKIPHVSSTNSLEKKFPGLAENDYIKLQQAERETIYDQFVKNQAWAHETRQAKLLGSSRQEGPDRVSFLTTSLGYPNVSVPADSLVGQYVIRRRKNLLKNEKIASGSALRGRFPEAVRDMHIVEFTTGTSVGFEGVGGLFHKTGWRAGGRRSKGYGKPVPVGSSVLRDSTGAPIYDAEGNIRYTEGATRKIKAGTERELGFGIYIG